MPVTTNDNKGVDLSSLGFTEVQDSSDGSDLSKYGFAEVKKKVSGNGSVNGLAKNGTKPSKPIEPDFGLTDPRKLALNQQSLSDNTTNKSVEETVVSDQEKMQHDERAAKVKADKEKLEKATPIAVEDAAKKMLKIKGLNPDNKTLLNKAKSFIQLQIDNGDAEVGLKDGKFGLIKNTGFLENFHDKMMGAINENKEVREFSKMTIPQKIDFAKKKMSEQPKEPSPYIGEKPTALGEGGGFLGGVTPTMGLYVAAAAGGGLIEAAGPETGFLSNLALKPVMSFVVNAGGGADHSEYRHTMERFAENKKQGMDDTAAMTKASEGKEMDRLAAIAETALFSQTGGAMKLGKSVTGNLLKGMAKEAVSGGAKVGGVEVGRSLGQGKSLEESIKNGVNAFEEAAPSFAVLHMLTSIVGHVAQSPKIIKNALKYDAVTKIPQPEIDEILEASVKAGTMPPEVSDKTKQELHEFRNALGKVPDGLSPEAEASAAGLEITLDKLKTKAEGKGQAAKDLAAQEIESGVNQIKEIVRTNKPLEHEINEATGETYKPPTFDDVQKQRVEKAADKIAKGKRLEDPEDIQAEQQFPGELKKELEKIKKSETPKEDETQSDAYKNVTKYLKKNEQATETQTQKEASSTQSESTENKTNETTTEEGTVENNGEKEPPLPPIEDVVEGNVHKEYPPTSLSYSGTGKIETEFGVDERLPTKTKHDIETVKQADNLLEDGWNVKDALNKMENEGHIPLDAEYINLTRYAAELSGRLRNTDIKSSQYDVTLRELSRVAKATDTYHGQAAGRSLGIRGRFKTVQDGTYADFMLTELNANNDAPLTDKQKETAQKDFSQLDEAKTKFEADRKAFEDKVAAFKAEQELAKQKKTASTGKRKNHEDLVKERQEIFTSISDKLKKARGETSVTLLPYANELIAIAPDVLKLARNLVEDGVIKLEEVIKNIHPQLKDEIPDLKERDIHDIIAGEYTKKKQTKSEVAKRMEDLRIEAGLINRLENLEKSVPKTEKEKVKRNQEIEKLRNQIKDYKKEQAEANKFFGEKDKTEANEEKEANKFYGEEKNPERAALASLKKKNIKETERIKEKLRTFDYEPDAKKTPLLEDKQLQKKFPNAFKDALKSRDALIEAKRKITIRRLQQMYDNKTPEEKTIEVFSKTLNVPRTLMASMDVSAPLRQAIVATTAHPQLASKALKFMFEAAANEKVYNRWLDDVHNSPRWEIAEKINLAITDPESLHVKEAEEAFQGAPYAEKIPIVGVGVKASERAYIGYLNKLRWDMFNMYADRFEAQGKVYENNPKLYEGLSSFINSATGRGNMKGLESAAPIFNWVLFASKLIASRINMLGLSDLPNLAVRGVTFGKYGLDYGFYSKLPPELRIEAAKDMLKFLAVGTATLLIAKQFGAEIELDPRSSDFGKIKVGNTRWDIWGGFQPYARVLTQVIAGERKATTNGRIYELDGEHFMGENRLSPLASFARGKLAPIPSAAINLFSGRDVIGNKVTVGETLENNLLPLIFNDVYKGMQDQGVKALFTVGIPSAFGVGVQTYDNTKKGGNGGGGGASGREPKLKEKKEKSEPRER